MSTFCCYEEELFTHVGAHCISYIVLGKTQKGLRHYLLIVCYNTSNLDSFAKEAQMAWNACRTDSDRGALALAIYEALDAPLDARFLAGLSEGRGEAGG